ncbi:hypothetical protein NDU88_002030 [Pleurodeles waltl]|uniref:Uncharacterized protein n=1 Tax=Pleurodeles waltl TaxID=8319 RepID=A0AAV7LB71_PLEWA|nr:hypothetical protein NDU88_002030 [Pleurodeles waltl]
MSPTGGTARFLFPPPQWQPLALAEQSASRSFSRSSRSLSDAAATNRRERNPSASVFPSFLPCEKGRSHVNNRRPAGINISRAK